MITIFLVMCSCAVMAQGPDDPPGDPSAPIDGGISLLVAAGVGYGVKKMRDKKKAHPEAQDK